MLHGKVVMRPLPELYLLSMTLRASTSTNILASLYIDAKVELKQNQEYGSHLDVYYRMSIYYSNWGH
jgi:hypothetical protein